MELNIVLVWGGSEVKTWGLALGAGGIYGFAHIGVLEVLESHGLRPGFVAGTSAGAIVASLWASSKTPGDFDATVSELLIDHEGALQTLASLMGAGSSVTGPASAMGLSGFLNGNWLESAIDKLTGGKRLSDVTIPLSIVSCDLISGDIVVFTNTDQPMKTVLNRERRYVANASLSTAVRASSSLPGVFAPKTLGSMELVDGGVREMVPAYEVRRMGAGEVLAVDLGSYIDRPQHARGIFSILTRSFNLASRGTTVAHLREHASLTLQPEVWDIGFPTPADFKQLIESGRACAKRNIGRWLELIS
jgi:NTE family protein